MKKIINQTILSSILIISGAMLLLPACRKGLLDQAPTTEVLQTEFWLTESDAAVALMGAYAATRPCFDRDYYFDGQAEYTRARGNSTTSGNMRLGDAYNGGNFNPSGYGAGFDKMYRYLFGAVHRTNYVVNNINIMIESNVGNRQTLESLIAEAKLLRALIYFKLISMWGDVPYFTKTVSNVASEANKDMLSQARLPIGQVKDSILADITYR